jgi:hypothetical protein
MMNNLYIAMTNLTGYRSYYDTINLHNQWDIIINHSQ